MAKVLILGGTAEARALAAALAPHHDVTTSLAGRTRNPKAVIGNLRTGGFGGADGLASFLKDNAFHGVIDATHPFAAQISDHARRACDATGTARLTLGRPAWAIPADATVVRVPTLDAAAKTLPAIARRAFLTVGVDSLAAFQGVKDVWMLARVLDAPAPPLPFEVIVARPPFDEAQERAVLRKHSIDTVVAKDAGGEATAAKIAAAIAEGATLLLIDRPQSQPGHRVETAAAAAAWVDAL